MIAICLSRYPPSTARAPLKPKQSAAKPSPTCKEASSVPEQLPQLCQVVRSGKVGGLGSRAEDLVCFVFLCLLELP